MFYILLQWIISCCTVSWFKEEHLTLKLVLVLLFPYFHEDFWRSVCPKTKKELWDGAVEMAVLMLPPLCVISMCEISTTRKPFQSDAQKPNAIWPYSPCTVRRCPTAGNSSATHQAPCPCGRPRTDWSSATAASSSCPSCWRGRGTPLRHRLRTLPGWSSSPALCHAAGPHTSSDLSHTCCLICAGEESVTTVSNSSSFQTSCMQRHVTPSMSWFQQHHITLFSCNKDQL